MPQHINLVWPKLQFYTKIGGHLGRGNVNAIRHGLFEAAWA